MIDFILTTIYIILFYIPREPIGISLPPVPHPAVSLSPSGRDAHGLTPTLEAEAAGSASGLTANAGGAGGLASAARVQSRARNGIAGHLGVDVDLDTGVGSLVGTGEADGGRGGVAATSDGELVARHVRLSTTGAAGRVQSDDLGTQEVVAGGDIRRDLDVDTAAALVEVLDTPEIIITAPAGRVLAPAVLVDLEPA